MIKRLQVKFVLLSMSAFLAVLLVIISSINIVNWSGLVREADAVLDILSENKGNFPADRIPMGGRLPGGMSPEVPYESRYFSVTLDQKTGSVLHVETSRIISVDSEQAASYASKIIDAEHTRGFVDEFRYRVRTERSIKRIIFLDCGRKLDAFQSFLLASIGISLLGYGVVFALIAFFSSRIIRPISESYEKQKRFITDAGHEIKTPLSIIKADADVLEMECGENEWLQDIQKQAKRLSALTSDLVLLSRMEEAENQMQMIDFSFSDAVVEAAASFQALAQTQNKSFHCWVEPMLTLRGNENAIQQLVGILLDNALKYSPEEGNITLAVKKGSRSLSLCVCNTTVSQVDKDTLPLLFDRFYRTDPSRSSQTGGYGIGLSIARAIVTAHGGKIQASTEDGSSMQISTVFPL